MRIALLGSTGSIGKTTLEVVKHLGYQIEALAAHQNIDLLYEQVLKFKPKFVAVFNRDKAKILRDRLPDIEVLEGMEGLLELTRLESVDGVVNGVVGAIGIEPTIEAIRAKKRIFLANKEPLVMAGELVMKLAKEHGVEVIPLDSEHSAIFQCLKGESAGEVRRLILTASGGPFVKKSLHELKEVTLDEALNHPSWSMGPKITVDSSTLMNKGLEVIEAHHLFGVPLEQIEVVVHPTSIIHSFVEFVDGSTIAQHSPPSMKLPIQYGLTHPRRVKGIAPCLDFTKYSKLEFFPPDKERFPCLNLAYSALDEGGSMPCFINAANEALVTRFLSGSIGWYEIGQKLETLMQRHNTQKCADLETLLGVDSEARTLANTI
ncbi:MAG: 1-deoxy-D-xylulose 5-phosphate reductoisomerase [Chlamydiia bacterium]|nr:1-deoxy-D-xylulose 5-phosphate reductoisomerase [Chlamydiia bacterium]MCH9616131.1 1-deoxy-D-xylulose 5-phosphate reductoisomerase [Chlamydiia bacterium]MCH9629446.1 1-deoxy-D-xylulose 5-phosphate reductoisomerase [Chlamydiia bacterium]